MKSTHITLSLSLLIIIIAVVAVVMVEKKKTSTEVVGEGTEMTLDEAPLVQAPATEDIIFGETITIELQDAKHVVPTEEYEPHNSNPPTSGAHLQHAPGWGLYDQEMTDLAAVHSLEHGGIWISYQPGLSAEEKKELKRAARKHPAAVIMSPRAANPAPIVVASWGKMMYLEAPDQDLILDFIIKNKNNSPEPLAR